MFPAAQSPAAPDHTSGHRERLRERWRAAPDALPDYELLEMMLFAVDRRADTKKQAKDLLSEFGGDLTAIFSAAPERLEQVGGIGPRKAEFLALLGQLIARAARRQVPRRQAIASWQTLVDYCRRAMEAKPVEGVIRDEVQNRGTVDHAPVYPREVVKRALQLEASSLILVHNHPSGDPTPSAADIEMTRLIVEAAKTFEISVHDHIVVGRNGHTSLKQQGLM